MKGINKSEFKYLIYATIFSFVTFVLILPNVINSITQLSPIFQFLIFNIGIFVFLQIFLKSVALGQKVKFGYTLGMVLLFMAIDIIVPPFLVNFNGTLNSGGTLFVSSSDYAVGLLAQSIGLSGFLVYIFTYIFSPLVLLIISSLLLKNFVKEL